MKRRTALAIGLALIVFVGVWVFVYFVEMSNTTRAVVWLGRVLINPSSGHRGRSLSSRGFQFIWCTSGRTSLKNF